MLATSAVPNAHCYVCTMYVTVQQGLPLQKCHGYYGVLSGWLRAKQAMFVH